MTLIIASARFSESLLVADRRVSDTSGKVIDEEAYKIIYFVNSPQSYSCAVGFTGLAELAGISTVDWLMYSLPEAMDTSTGISHAIEGLKDSCNNLIAPKLSRTPAELRALTLVLCGRYTQYHRTTGATRQAPFLAVISNSAGSAGRQRLEVSDSFSAYSAWPSRPSRGISICRGDLRAAGGLMAELQDVFRYLRRNIAYAAKVKIAANFISLVSTRSHWVGESVLGLSIPDGGGAAEAFDYTVSTGKQVKTIPHMVSASGGGVTNFRVEPL